MTTIEHTLQSWATALGMERRTLESRIVKAEIHWTQGTLLTAKQVYTALMGDKEAETIENLRLDKIRKQREEDEAQRQLVRMDEVEKLLTEAVLWPLSQSLIDAKATGKADAAWVDETMKRIRDGLPKERL